jgi:uncharacterized protein YidB (DUF937 family)
MSLLDSVLSNPQLANAAKSLLSNNDASVGSGDGIYGIMQALQSSGLQDVVASWLGNGANQAIAPDRLESALGADTLQSFARKAGVDGSEASAILAGMLPALFDQLSPNGELPAAGGLDQVLGGLLGSGSRPA